MKYCECFNHQIKCSPLCSCQNCHNKGEIIFLPESLKIPKKNHNRYKKSLQIFGQFNKRGKKKTNKSFSMGLLSKDKQHKRVKEHLSTLNDLSKNSN
jgi:hypothetical protein